MVRNDVLDPSHAGANRNPLSGMMGGQTKTLQSPTNSVELHVLACRVKAGIRYGLHSCRDCKLNIRWKVLLAL